MIGGNVHRLLSTLLILVGTPPRAPLPPRPTANADRTANDGARGGTRGRDSVTAFVNVAVIPMDRERVLPNQTVVVRGDRIIALGPVADVPVPLDAIRIDGRGQYLLPGLGDMHVHISRGWRPANLPDVLLAFVANGVTTIRDMHSGGDDTSAATMPLLQAKRRVARGELLGPQIYTAGDPDPTPSQAAASVAALRTAGHEFVKVTEFDKSGYDSIKAAADRLGLRLVGHVPPEVGLEAALADHWASIEHLTHYLNYVIGVERGRREVLADALFGSGPAVFDTMAWLQPGYRLDEGRLRQIAAATERAGVWNCPTLIAAERWASDNDISPDWQRPWRQFLDLNLQIVKALQDAGAGLLLGTDAPVGGLPGFTIHRELELLVAAGLTPYQALATGTRNVAEFLGTDANSGTVAVGKRADLLLLRANPLRNIRHTTALAGVMVGGRWLPRVELETRLDAVEPVPYFPYLKSLADTLGTFAVQMRWARQLLWH